MVDNLDVTDKMMDEVFDGVNAGGVNDAEVNNIIEYMQEEEKGGANMVNAQQDQIGAQQEQVGANANPFGNF